MLPARGRGVVITLVLRVPAQDHVAKPEAALGIRLGGAKELVDVQVLAPQDAVDVAHSHFDFAVAFFAHSGDGGVFFGCRHESS